MLRLRDVRSGDLAPVAPARASRLSIFTACDPPAGPALGCLRSFLLADLIGRVAARRGLQVSAWTAAPPGAAEFWAACGALNIYPAQFSAEPPDPLDVGVWGPSPAPSGARGGHWVRPGQVLTDLPGTDALAGAGDPLALRLVFMTAHYARSLQLSPAGLSAAGATLRRWRERVAAWATHPSRPIPAPHLAQLAQAFDNDLDTPAALGALASLAADERIAPGAKFETFASFDQVLGLDLACDVGR